MREGNFVQVSNPHLSTIDEDFLVRFKIGTTSHKVVWSPSCPWTGARDGHFRSETRGQQIKNFETVKVSFWASFKALKPRRKIWRC